MFLSKFEHRYLKSPSLFVSLGLVLFPEYGHEFSNDLAQAAILDLFEWLEYQGSTFLQC
jgi:hypothetical protein